MSGIIGDVDFEMGNGDGHRMSHRNRSTLVLGALFLCALVVVIAVVSVLRNERVQAAKEAQIAAGRQKLGEWEGRDVAASQAQIDAALERLHPTPEPTPEATAQPTDAPGNTAPPGGGSIR